MSKKIWLIIGGVLAMMALAAALLLPRALPRAEVDEDCVIVQVDGAEYARIPLSQPQTLVIRQKSGAVNEVEVTETGARMVSSNCQNQHCVQQGHIALWETEWKGSVIVCLPNKVILELAEAAEETAISADDERQ